MNDAFFAAIVKILTAINAVALATFVGLFLRHRIASRKVGIEEGDSDRKGWRELVDTLSGQIDHLSGHIKELRDENELLRKEIRGLHAIIDGMRRENQAAQISGQRVIRDHLEALPQPGKSQ